MQLHHNGVLLSTTTGNLQLLVITLQFLQELQVLVSLRGDRGTVTIRTNESLAVSKLERQKGSFNSFQTVAKESLESVGKKAENDRNPVNST